MEMTCVCEYLIFPLSGDLLAFDQNSSSEAWQETQLINHLDAWKTASLGGMRCHGEVTYCCLLS